MCADTPDLTKPDYKDTLNLPRTEFPMRAGLPQREPEILKFWYDAGLYERLSVSEAARALDIFRIRHGDGPLPKLPA